jgi:hypothetical protein
VADQYDHEALDEVVDFSQVHADDAFLDALGAAEPDADGAFADDRLAALLLSWRQDVDAEPIHELVDPKLAVATVQAARVRQRRGPRLLAPLAAAAAVLTIAFAGVGLAARDAQPGDTLWGLTRVLYSDHARSVEAAAAVRTDLREAQEALSKGKVAEAKSMLDQARHALPTVASEDGQADLVAQHAALLAKLPDNPAVGAPPPPAASPSTAPGSQTQATTTTPTQPTTVNPPPTSDTTTTTTTTTEPSTSSVQSEPNGGRSETTGNAPAGGSPNGNSPNGGNPDGGAAPNTIPAGTAP